jgi:hypothetical protein
MTLMLLLPHYAKRYSSPTKSCDNHTPFQDEEILNDEQRKIVNERILYYVNQRSKHHASIAETK